MDNAPANAIPGVVQDKMSDHQSTDLGLGGCLVWATPGLALA